MVSSRALKIGAAGVAVTALAIGLGVGLSKNNKPVDNNTSLAQAQGFDGNQCRRLIDGRYVSSTNDVFEGKTRNLQWSGDGHLAPASKGAAAKSKPSKASYSSAAVCAKSKATSAYDPCNPVQYVPCACPVMNPKPYSPPKQAPYNPKPSVPKYAPANLKSSGSGWGADGHSSASKMKPANYNSKANGSKGWGAAGYSSGGKQSSKGSLGGSGANSKPSGAWRSDGHRDLQWGNDGFKGSTGGASYSGGGSKKGPSSGGSFTSSKGSTGAVKAASGGGSKKGSSSGGSYSSFKGSTATGTCMCAVPSSTPVAKGSTSNMNFCTCLAPAMSKSKGTDTTGGMVPVPCPCSEPNPVSPALCQPTPVPTPKPVVNIFDSGSSVTTPAPTPCMAKRFYFVQVDGVGVCSNGGFIGNNSYGSAAACCSANFGAGSFFDGRCNYIDDCSSVQPTPAPFTLLSSSSFPTTGSTPTVATDATVSPTMEARGD